MVFAALFSGAVSMDEEVLIDKPGCHKSTLVFRMQLATEVSLGRAHLSQTSRLQTIQAYVMYLVRAHSNSILIQGCFRHDAMNSCFAQQPQCKVD